jgi:hypothetical protein
VEPRGNAPASSSFSDWRFYLVSLGSITWFRDLFPITHIQCTKFYRSSKLLPYWDSNPDPQLQRLLRYTLRYRAICSCNLCDCQLIRNQMAHEGGKPPSFSYRTVCSCLPSARVVLAGFEPEFNAPEAFVLPLH